MDVETDESQFEPAGNGNTVDENELDEIVDKLEDLGETSRGEGGFGSTGS